MLTALFCAKWGFDSLESIHSTYQHSRRKVTAAVGLHLCDDVNMGFWYLRPTMPTHVWRSPWHWARRDASAGKVSAG